MHNCIEQKQGIRAKVETEDKNEIDTLFFDRRTAVGNNGKTLVCSLIWKQIDFFYIKNQDSSNMVKSPYTYP